MARHRKVSVAIWNDEKFRALSDDGELLFLFLLTHPQQTSLGAMRATMGGLAEERRWLPDKLLKAFAEASHQGMAKYDRDACCLWLPNFLKYNGPESPNVVKAWAGALDLIPECSLKLLSVQRAKAILKDYDDSFMEAFLKAFPKGVLRAIDAPSLNPEPEQEPYQEQKPEQEKTPTRAHATQSVARTEGNPTRAGVIDCGTALTSSAEDLQAEADNRWREEPGLNVEAMQTWIDHCARLEEPKHLPAHVRLSLAKTLAGYGDAAIQARAVARCVQGGWRNLRQLPPDELAANGKSTGRPLTTAQLEDREVRRLAAEGRTPEQIAAEVEIPIDRVRSLIAEGNADAVH